MPADPDSRTADAASSAVGVHAVKDQIEVSLPVVDAVVSQNDLGEAWAVGLHPGIAPVAVDGRRAPKNKVAFAAVEHGCTHVSFSRINGDRLAGNSGLKESRGHAIGGPWLLRSGLKDQSDLKRDDGQPESVHSGRIGWQDQSQNRALALVAD